MRTIGKQFFSHCNGRWCWKTAGKSTKLLQNALIETFDDCVSIFLVTWQWFIRDLCERREWKYFYLDSGRQSNQNLVNSINVEKRERFFSRGNVWSFRSIYWQPVLINASLFALCKPNCRKISLKGSLDLCTIRNISSYDNKCLHVLQERQLSHSSASCRQKRFSVSNANLFLLAEV